MCVCGVCVHACVHVVCVCVCVRACARARVRVSWQNHQKQWLSFYKDFQGVYAHVRIFKFIVPEYHSLTHIWTHTHACESLYPLCSPTYLDVSQNGQYSLLHLLTSRESISLKGFGKYCQEFRHILVLRAKNAGISTTWAKCRGFEYMGQNAI